ncbi:peroxiredoxin-like family protein [Streptomyces orinoci]|uniref:thioredoxin-dependent peroxiredoxin n=1 Tax=Streptomyces orinoci TaxID=67339 RepID=A0ABV3JVM4_STRON|nr:peroxiredoxin-like family protein [Streptomyces orinoci]
MNLRDELRELSEQWQHRLPVDAREVMERGARELAATGIAGRALQVGERAPEFTLNSALGEQVTLSGLLAGGPVVLTFYRGAWCPYCNLALRALQRHHEDFRARGACLVAVSPQIPDESLTLAEKERLAFPVLSDIGSRVAASYGIAFELSGELGGKYDEFGFDLARVNAGHARTLPLPATFVIDGEGTVRWSFVDTDYTVRAEPAEILSALDALG